MVFRFSGARPRHELGRAVWRGKRWAAMSYRLAVWEGTDGVRAYTEDLRATLSAPALGKGSKWQKNGG